MSWDRPFTTALQLPRPPKLDAREFAAEPAGVGAAPLGLRHHRAARHRADALVEPGRRQARRQPDSPSLCRSWARRSTASASGTCGARVAVLRTWPTSRACRSGCRATATWPASPCTRSCSSRRWFGSGCGTRRHRTVQGPIFLNVRTRPRHAAGGGPGPSAASAHLRQGRRRGHAWRWPLQLQHALGGEALKIRNVAD